MLAIIAGDTCDATIREVKRCHVDSVGSGMLAPAAVFVIVDISTSEHADMIYPPGQRRDWGRNGSVPDVSRMETRLWFYYQAASYIDLGCEAIHFGQVEIMNRNDRELSNWSQVLSLVRAYAAKHARRHMVLCDGHVPSGGLLKDGMLLLDFHSFPLRIMEVPDKPTEAVLKVGFPA